MAARFINWFRFSSPAAFYPLAGRLISWFALLAALLIGVALLWLGRKGRIMWLQVWSAGLIFFSVLYLAAATMGWI